MSISKVKKSFLIPDSTIPALYFLATGKKWKTAKSLQEVCVNDLRRFFEIGLLYCVGKNIPKDIKLWH